MKINDSPFQLIAVLFCKHFPAIVRKVQSNQPFEPETAVGVVQGCLVSVGDGFITVTPPEYTAQIDRMVANGYTVTGYLRLSDSSIFIPFHDEPEASVAQLINQIILQKHTPAKRSNATVSL